jgi:hypothetical protein
MADNTLPPEGLSGAREAQPDVSQRRAFLRRAVGVGVPVVLATVRGRSVLAQDTSEFGSGCASAHPSGWLFRGDDASDVARAEACEAFPDSGAAPPLEQPEAVTEPSVTEPSATEPSTTPEP